MTARPDDAGVAPRRDALVAWLDGHTDYESAMPTPAGRCPRSTGSRELCRLLGDPERACPVVHITGTNGKGSTARILTELLMANGPDASGTYTSPNLDRVNERLARDGEPIDDDELAEVLGAAGPARAAARRAARPASSSSPRPPSGGSPTSAVDVAVVEVGLGGRWDATNVVEPDVAVVTNVSYDHAEVLGPTLEDIAAEKAGIIKPGCRRAWWGRPTPSCSPSSPPRPTSAGAAEIWVRGEEFACDANRVAVGGRLLDLRTPGAAYPEVSCRCTGPTRGTTPPAPWRRPRRSSAPRSPPRSSSTAWARCACPGGWRWWDARPLVVLDGAHNVAGAQALAAALRRGVRRPTATTVVVDRDAPGPRPERHARRRWSPAGVARVVACAPPIAAGPARRASIAEAARALGLPVQRRPTRCAEAVALARGPARRRRACSW